ncbi:MAG: hypothetical protein IPM63_07585 [Acidobacteriota bacterium]|nr:MAG: hypothetical protein IPM63_07585 [Acidobacteriota bacterium]
MAEKKIRQDPLYGHLDEVCGKIPLPADAKLVGIKGLYNISTLGYFYEAKGNGRDFVQHAEEFLKKDGWRLSSDQPLAPAVVYEKGNARVDLYWEHDHADFSIFCGLVDTQKGISLLGTGDNGYSLFPDHLTGRSSWRVR